MIPIAGFCKRDTIPDRESAFMFSIEDRSFAVIDTPVIGNCVFMIVSDEEWEAHRIVMKPTVLP